MVASRIERPIGWGAVVAVLALNAVELSAQALITTRGSGSVSLEPDRASVRFQIETVEPSAREASNEVGRRLERLRDALDDLGIDRDSIVTPSFSVSPEVRIVNGRRREQGYGARIVFRVPVPNLEILSEIIDSGLDNGATSLWGVDFSSTRADSARARALELAVADAMFDAEVLARAAGGSLGDLVELTTEHITPVQFQSVQTARERARVDEVAMARSPSLQPNQIVVTATVVGRWQMND